MKFGKQLKEQSVAAWQEYYMSYKRLKRVIKKLVVQLNEKEALKQFQLHHAQALQKQNIGNGEIDTSITITAAAAGETTQLLTITADGRKEFNAVLENDIDKINDFFLEKLDKLRHTQSELMPTDNNNSSNNSNNNDDTHSDHTTAPQQSSNIFSRTISINSSKLLRPAYNTIGSDPVKQQEEQCKRALDYYRECLQLRSYSDVNYMGFSKILKKFDKNTHSDTRDTVLSQCDTLPFRQQLQHDLLLFTTTAEDAYIKHSLALHRDMTTVMQTLAAVQKDVEHPQHDGSSSSDGSHVKPLWILFALLSGAACCLIPILPAHEVRAHRCLGLLAYVTVMWVTEAVPFFVTSITIPLLVVVAGILTDNSSSNNTPLTASQASKAAFGSMFNDTVMLILGGFSLSAAASKCQFELLVASVIQQQCGHRPRLFLLAFMLLGATLSMWISNVAAPVLLTALVLPIVRDFGRGSAYARTLLLGVAVSCNIGGMMSPIASPQNAIALGVLEDSSSSAVAAGAVAAAYSISFGQWVLVSLPFCAVAVVLSWLYLTLALLSDQDDVPACIPTIVYEPQPLSSTHVVVVVTTVLTVTCWCSLSYTRPLLGEMGTVAVLPFVLLFGSGVLTKTDLLQFSWNLVLLVGGGSVLGSAVNSSRLLHIVAASIEPHLQGNTAYVQCVAVLCMVFVVTTFVSHTVAALILAPLIVEIGISSGSSSSSSDGSSISSSSNSVQPLLMAATLMMSGTMSLPMSSFPNVNALLVEDDFNRPFLHPIDFLKHGTVIALMLLVLTATWGYLLMMMVF